MFFGRRTAIEAPGLARAAEHFAVSSTGLHLRVDFIVERADATHAAVRVVLNRAFAEKACGALETTIAKYQAAHGPIRVAREPTPAQPRFSSMEERPLNQLKVSYADEGLFLDFRLMLSTPEKSSEFDRVFVVTAIGLAPPLLAAMRASLRG